MSGPEKQNPWKGVRFERGERGERNSRSASPWMIVAITIGAAAVGAVGGVFLFQYSRPGQTSVEYYDVDPERAKWGMIVGAILGAGSALAAWPWKSWLQRRYGIDTGAGKHD